VKRKEQLLIYSLGRVTNPYRAAKAFFRSSPKGRRIGLAELGAWYTCKKQLFHDGFVIEKPVVGKSRPFEANLSKYFSVALKNSPYQEDVERENLPLFEKYAPKIVDFLIENDLLNEMHESSYPIVFFLFARYLASITDQIHDLPLNAKMGEFQSFVDLLPNAEQKELAIPLENQKELWTTLETAFNLLPPETFREIFMELDMKVLAAITFRKKLLDRLVHWVAGSPARAQFLIAKMNEYDQRETKEAEIEEQEEHDRILREQQATDA
jgi:hypothetical protein